MCKLGLCLSHNIEVGPLKRLSGQTRKCTLLIPSIWERFGIHRQEVLAILQTRTDSLFKPSVMVAE